MKFRVWDKKGKKWYKDSEVVISGGGQAYFIDEFSQLLCFPIHHIGIQPFTSFKDRSGKEIYKGDILSDTMDTGFSKHTVRGIVEKDKYGAWIFGSGYVYDFDGQCEIIGNKLENPEILEEMNSDL